MPRRSCTHGRSHRRGCGGVPLLSVRIATRSEGSTLRVHGLILSGGASRRFGTDKALATIDGKALIDYVIDALRPCVDVLSLVGGPPDWATERALEHVADDVDRAGPLLGLAAGVRELRCVSDDVIVVAPCDTPLVHTNTFRRLIDEAARSGGAVARTGDHSHWTLSAWTAPTVQAACDEGRKSGATSLHEVFEPLKPASVDVDPIEVENVNTPEDLSRAARSLAH